MSWDIDTAKRYLGITGSDQDQEVQAAMDTTLAAVETVLQRDLFLGEQTATFLQEAFHKIPLRRYPVKTITTVDEAAMDDTWELQSEVGAIVLPCRQYFDKLEIVYEGGYETLPANLERAMYEALTYLWGRTDPVTGGPDDGGLETDPSGAAGEVSRVTVQDFGSVTFDTGASLSGDAAAKSTQSILDWGWLYPWASTLQYFRSEQGTGLGMA